MKEVKIELKRTKINKSIFKQSQTYNAIQTHLIPIGWVVYGAFRYFVVHNGEGLVFKRGMYEAFEYKVDRYIKDGEPYYEHLAKSTNGPGEKFETKEEALAKIKELNEYRNKFFELGQFYL